jgi:cell division protein FtsW
MELRKPAPLVGRRVDYSIAVIVLALIAIGLVMVYSTGWVSILKQTGGASDRNSLFYNQLVSFGLGLVVWYACTKIPLSWLRRAAPYVFYISLALMFLVLVPKIGVNINGASRWVRLGFLNFQPVEFFKLGFVLYLAHWLQKNNSKLNVKSWLEGLLPFLILLFVSAGLVTVIQRNMGIAVNGTMALTCAVPLALQLWQPIRVLLWQLEIRISIVIAERTVDLLLFSMLTV